MVATPESLAPTVLESSLAPHPKNGDLPRWAAWFSVSALAAVLVAVQWRSFAPVFANDEVGILGASRLIARPATDWLLTGDSYMPGLSVLIAPAWWVTSDPLTVYRIAVLLCVVIALLTVLPLANLARRFGAAPNLSVVVAAIALAAPARALESNYVWAENLLVLLVSCTLAAAWRFADAPTVRSAALLAVAAGGAVFAHGRALPFALVMIAVAVLASWRRLSVWLTLVAVGGAVLALAYALLRYVSESIYFESDRVGSTLDDISRATPLGYVEILASQVWYQIAAWAGLTALGAAALFTLAVRSQSRRVGVLVAAPLVAMILTVPLLLADSPDLLTGVHVHFYGRYLDAFLLPLAVAGLVRVAAGLSVRTRVTLAATVVVVSIAFLAWVAPAIPVGANLTSPHVPGVAHLLHPTYAVTGDAENWTVVAILAAVPALALLAISRWRAATIVVLGIAAAVGTVVSDARNFDPLEESMRSPRPAVVAVEAVDPGVPLHANSRSTYAVTHGNILSFWLAERGYIYVDPADGIGGVQMMLGDLDDPGAQSSGSRALVDSEHGASVVWVLPGPLADALDAQGLLEAP